jgi:murein DD-endopeptidase MepM/ murein hydrolase activator NlpD
MDNKSFSLIVVPYNRGRPKTISLSEKKVKILAGIAALLFIALVVFLIDYSTMNVTRQKYRKLFEESISLKGTIVKYKVSINRLEHAVQDFENYSKKINVMAGLRSPRVLKAIGVGGGDRSLGQEMSSSNYLQDIGLIHAERISKKAEEIDKNLNALVSFFEQRTNKLASTPTIWPVTGWLTSAFGKRTDPFTRKIAFHNGIDIAASTGNPILATADGFVSHVKREKLGGNVVIISHGGGYTTVYCHLSKFKVNVGQQVKREDIIGLIGNTGKSLGPHLHYEVRVNGTPVNPYYHILEE